MKTYEIQFIGRTVGAIGKFYPIRAQVFAADAEAAKLKLYDRFEHITGATVKEITSPFDSDCLFDYANDTRTHSNGIRAHVARMCRLIDCAAWELAQANQNWHDDKDAPDHALFQAQHLEQFPREMRDAAVLDLVKRHLEIINENEAARAARESEVANAK